MTVLPLAARRLAQSFLAGSLVLAPASASAAADPPPAASAPVSPRGLMIVLPELVFAPGQTALQADALRSVDQIAALLREYPERRLRIVGFGDADGATRPEEKLAQGRAEAVHQALLASGVAPERMEVRSDTAVGASPMRIRRVELRLSDAEGRFGPP